jgi:tRNA/rRNA methyltransferase
MIIQFILVEPAVPENIGASARAIKTMGFDRLILVNPCSWKEGKSRWVAHGSGDILDNAVEAATLSEALKDSDFAVATSARQRTVRQDYIPAGELGLFLRSKSNAVNKVSIVFGREESGLTNEEMKLCDVTSTIRMKASYPSLNLSHAVMLYAYELAETGNEDVQPSELPGQDSFRLMKEKAGRVLNQLGISDDDNRYGRILERISFLNHDDVNLVHTICNLLLEKSGNGS